MAKGILRMAGYIFEIEKPHSNGGVEKVYFISYF
jgi:hypothetical protein